MIPYRTVRLAALGMLATLGLVHVAQVPAQAEVSAAPLDLAQYRGKVVYVDFWASWCGPCKLSFPFMQELRRQYGANDLVIITVNVDHDRTAAANFLKSVGGDLPVVYDPTGALAGKYQVASMPTSILIGRNGQQRFVHRGYFPNKAAEYRAHIDALVAEHP